MLNLIRLILCIILCFACKISFAQETHVVLVTINQPADCNEILGVEQSTQGFSVYPNPVHDQLRVTVPHTTLLSLLDMNNKLVYSTSLNAGTASLDVRHLSRGTYMLRFKSAQHHLTFKIIKD